MRIIDWTPKAIGSLAWLQQGGARSSLKKSKACNELIHFAETSTASPNINCYLEQISDTPIRQKTKLKELILRPNLNITDIATIGISTRIEQLKELREEVSESVSALKYEGYIKREQQQAEKLRRLEEVHIPTQLCYERLLQLSTEARQKLSHIRPITIELSFARIKDLSARHQHFTRYLWQIKGKSFTWNKTIIYTSALQN